MGPYSRFLGYDKGPNGELVVNPEQAELVRRIFSMFLQGKTAGEIARILTAEGARTGTGCIKWRWDGVMRILTNEKYKGDALLQKTFIPDFFNKKQVKNTRRIPHYYVEGNHEAIIEPEVFDEVQREMARRKNAGIRVANSKDGHTSPSQGGPLRGLRCELRAENLALDEQPEARLLVQRQVRHQAAVPVHSSLRGGVRRGRGRHHEQSALQQEEHMQ